MRFFTIIFMILLISVQSIAQEIKFQVIAGMDFINAISFMPDGERVAIGGYSEDLKIMSISSNTYTAIPAAIIQIKRIAVSKKGRYIATGSVDESIKILSTESNSLIKKIPYDNNIITFDFHPAEDILCYFSDESIMKTGLTKTSIPSTLFQRKRGESPFSRIRFSPAGEVIAASGEDANIYFISYPTGQILSSINTQGRPVQDFCFSPDGTLFAMGVEDKIFIVNYPSGTIIKTLTEHSSTITCLKFQPDNNRFLISRSMDQKIFIWSVIEGKSIDSIQIGGARAHVFDISPDGNTLAALFTNKKVNIYDLKAILKKYTDQLADASENSLKSKDWDKTINTIQRIEKYLPLNDTQLLWRGIAYYEKGDFNAASTNFAASGKINPLNHDCLIWQLKLYDSKGMKKEAYEVACNLLKLEPDNINVKCSMVKYLFDNNKFDEIKRLFNKVENLNIPDNNCYLQVAGSYENTHDYPTAIRLFSNYSARYPADIESKVHLANCFIKTKNFTASINILDSLLRQNKSTEESLWLLAISYFYKGDMAKTKISIDRYNKQYANKNRGLELSGLNKIICKNYLNAADDFYQSLKIDSTNAFNSFQYFYSLALANKFQEAFNYLGIPLQSQTLEEPGFFDPELFGDTIRDYIKLWTRSQQELLDSLRTLSLDIQPKRNHESLADYDARQSGNQLMVQKVFDYNNNKFTKKATFLFERYTYNKVENLTIEGLGAYDKANNRQAIFILKKKYWVKANLAEANNIKNNLSALKVRADKRLRDDFQGYELSGIRIIATFPPFTFTAEPDVVTPEKPPVENLAKAEGATRGVERVNAPAPATNTTYKNYLFVIGIDNYKYWEKLDNPVNDAKDFANTLMTRYLFDKENSIELYNEEANWESIDSTFRHLKQTVRENDRLIIYYAGHGEYDTVKEKGYIVPCEARKGVTKDYYNYDEILTWVYQINSKHTLLFVDACSSGAILLDKMRGAAKPVTNELENHKSRFGITSGRLETSADSYRNTNHSPFSYFLLQILNDNQLPNLTIYQLYDQLQQNLQQNRCKAPMCGPLKDTNDKNGVFVFHLRTP